METSITKTTVYKTNISKCQDIDEMPTNIDVNTVYKLTETTMGNDNKDIVCFSCPLWPEQEGSSY